MIREPRKPGIIRQRIAAIADRVRPQWCRVDLWEWSRHERKWCDINRRCRDAQISGQPTCWCGKQTHDGGMAE